MILADRGRPCGELIAKMFRTVNKNDQLTGSAVVLSHKHRKLYPLIMGSKRPGKAKYTFDFELDPRVCRVSVRKRLELLCQEGGNRP